MKLPKPKQAREEKEAFCTAFEGIFPETGAKAWQITAADPLRVTGFPHIAPRAPRFLLDGICSNAKSVFVNEKYLCILAREGDGDHLYLCDTSYALVRRIPLPSDGGWDGSSPVFGTWYDDKLYLPGCRAVVDTAVYRAGTMRHTSVSGTAYVDESELEPVLRVVFDTGVDLSAFVPGHCVQALLYPDGVLTRCTLRVRANFVSNNKAYFYLEGEQLAGMGSIEDTPNITVYSGYPEFEGMLRCGDRMYGFLENRVYFSEVGEPTVFERGVGLQTDRWSSVLTLPDPACITAGCVFKGQPLFFTTRGAVVLEGKESTPRSIVIPGVSPRMAHTVTVIGDEVYYAAGGCVYAFDGNDCRLVKSNVPALYEARVGGTDGRRYWLLCGEGNTQVCAVWDPMQGIWNQCAEPAICGGLQQLDCGVLTVQAYGGKALPAMLGDPLQAPSPLARWGHCEGAELITDEWPHSFVLFAKEPLKRGELSPHTVLLEAEIAAGAELCVYVLYDTESGESAAGEIKKACLAGHPPQGAAQYRLQGGEGRRTLALPCMPRRAKSWRVALCGSGEYTVYGIGSRKFV